MAADKQIYQMVLPGYWMDIGQPHDYLSGQSLYLRSLYESEQLKGQLATGANIKGNVIIHETAKVDPSSVIGPDVVIGPDCVVGPGNCIKQSTLLAGSKVDSYSLIDGSIIGWKSSIGKWCRVTSLAVIAEDVQVKDETYLNGTKILPHKGVNGCHPETGKIIM